MIEHVYLTTIMLHYVEIGILCDVATLTVSESNITVITTNSRSVSLSGVMLLLTTNKTHYIITVENLHLEVNMYVKL